MTPYQRALATAAEEYDPHALSARNEREGIAARRLAVDHAEDLRWITRDMLGHLRTERERVMAQFAQGRLNVVMETIGKKNFRAMVKAYQEAVT